MASAKNYKVSNRDVDGSSARYYATLDKARRFEVMSEPVVYDLRADSVALTKVRVNAYPLNEDGKRMSGRAGNSSCASGDMVTIHYDLCGAVAFDDERSDAEILLDAVRRSTKA